MSLELDNIKYEECHHFTVRRMIFTLICFFALFFTSMFFGSKANKSPLPDWARFTILGVFITFSLLITYFVVKEGMRIHEIKERDGYKFVASDI